MNNVSIDENLKEVILEIIRTCPPGIRPSFAIKEALGLNLTEIYIKSMKLSLMACQDNVTYLP